MEMLSVQNLEKRYERFALKNVSFSLDQGYIMGFVGRNGAGKTTTLKSMLNIVHPDGGKISVMGKDFFDNELVCKQKIGCVFGGVDYYPKKKLKTIASVVRNFYDAWDNDAYGRYLARFDLDPEKKICELSNGMKVKFGLALALSHHAQLLILDEPTSGLDPVSRDDLIGLFQELIEDGDLSILFSTHITSDLEKCADFITYIKNGEIVASTEMDTFLDSYRLVKGIHAQLSEELSAKLIGCKKNSFGFSGLVKVDRLPLGDVLEISPCDLETIMIYCERE